MIAFHFIPYNVILSIPSDALWLTLDHVLCIPPPPIADCQKPQATEAFVLSKAALLLNNFPEGLQVILQCGHGYNRISGSGATVCSNGQWSKPDLICEGKPPTAVSNYDYFVFGYIIVD